MKYSMNQKARRPYLMAVVLGTALAALGPDAKVDAAVLPDLADGKVELRRAEGRDGGFRRRHLPCGIEPLRRVEFRNHHAALAHLHMGHVFAVIGAPARRNARQASYRSSFESAEWRTATTSPKCARNRATV